MSGVVACTERLRPQEFQKVVKIVKIDNKNNDIDDGVVAQMLPFAARMLPAGCPFAANELPTGCLQVAELMP